MVMSSSRRQARTPPTVARVTSGPILGIDPGLQRTGYAILSDCNGPQEARVTEAGVVRLVRQLSLEQRLAHLDESLGTLIANHRPAALICEELYAHYRHPRTAILMAHARGVILALAARSGLQVTPVTATRVKKMLTGSGRATKAQVQRAIAVTLGLATIPEPDDVADALAIALCGLRLRRQAADLGPGQREAGP